MAPSPPHCDNDGLVQEREVLSPEPDILCVFGNYQILIALIVAQ